MPANWQPSASLDTIRERARIYRQIRSFFNQRGCLEVDTPLLMPHGNPDANIESLYFELDGVKQCLQTSPEFAMKRLLAADSGSIFQICHAFRGGERGRLHHVEFSLLEWYRVGYDYQQLMNEIELLITSLSLKNCQFSRIRYRELFQQCLDIDIDEIDLADLRELCGKRVDGCNSNSLEFDQCLDLLLSLLIAPSLAGYLFVYDYPVSQASLARCLPNDSAAERFELFYDGIELANGFSELTDAKEQRARFTSENRIRESRGQAKMEIDERLLDAMEAGLPDCAGVALGLDRLLMILLDCDSIEQVLTFTSGSDQ